MDDIKLYELAVALEQDATWDSGGGCVGVLVAIEGNQRDATGFYPQLEVFFGFSDGYLGWDINHMPEWEHVASGAADDMTEDLDIATLAARCRQVLSEL